MKKTLILFLSTTALSVNAQFNIDHNYGFLAGDNVESVAFSLDTNGVEGKAGANQLWDFGAYIIDNSKVSVLNIEPVTNSVIADYVISSASKSEYYIADENALSIVEETNSFERSGNEIAYSPSRTLINYPLEFGSEQQNTFKGSLRGTGIDYAPRNGVYSIKSDGFGRIRLPNNQTYDNAVRVKSTCFTIDSIPSTSIVTNTKTTYSYYAQDVRVPVAEITYNIDSNIVNNKIFVSKSAVLTIYNPSKITAIDDNEIQFNTAFYPNPLLQNSTLHLTDKIVGVEVYNILGVLVYSHNLKERNIVLPLESGVYIVKSTDSNGQVQSHKLIVK